MGMSGHERPNKGASDDWLTPLPIIQSLGEFMMDPCGYENHPTARLVYHKERICVAPWVGRVWLNPPYSEVQDWMRRLIAHGRGVALVFARTDTRWFQEAAPYTSSIFFPERRIRFINPRGESKYTAGAPSVFLAFGETPDWGKLPMKGWRAK